MNDRIQDQFQYLRVDSITGIGNALAFFEWLLSHADDHPILPFTLISLDVKNLAQLNKTHGHTAGDAALRWIALVLLEEARAQVYRISGDEFVGVLTEGTVNTHSELCERVLARLIKESSQVNLEPPAAHLAMIHFKDLERISPEDVLGVIYGALIEIKDDLSQSLNVFDTSSTIPAAAKAGLVNDMVRRMVSLGSMLDKSHKLAYNDPITGLPNLHAVTDELDQTIQLHISDDQFFAILLIDGDDLGKYNKISYLEGDEMIARLGNVLKHQMRPSDYLARWRTGDEFLVLLHNTPLEQAISIADRVRMSVKESSLDWIYPITVSVGVAGYPDHGITTEELLHQAELAINQAKKLGKNQVFIHR